MANEILGYLSYGLAMLVAAICFLLVKHTADEFDRWYDQPRFQPAHLPVAAISLILVVGALAALL